MTMSLTLPSNGQGADVSTVNIPFGQVQTVYNAHVAGGGDNHDTTQITDGVLSEATTVTNSGGQTTHQRLDMIFVMLSAIMGGSGNATTRYGGLPNSITGINATLAAATTASTSTTIVKRDSNNGASFGYLSVIGVNTGIATVLVRPITAQVVAPFIVQNAAGTVNNAYIDTAGNIFSVGTIQGTTLVGTVASSQLSGVTLAAQEPAHTGDVTNTAGSLALTVVTVGGTAAATIAAGAALANAAVSINTINTIVKRDGSGNFTAGTITAALTGNATNVTGIVAAANGGTGLATLTSGSILVGAGTGAATFLTPGATNNIIYATGASTWTSGPMISAIIPNGLIFLNHVGAGRAAASVSPNTTVNIGGLRYVNNSGVLRIVSATTFTYDSSNGTKTPPTVGTERWDLFYYDQAGTLNVITNGNQATGTATQIAVPISASAVVCYVFLRASTTQILDTDDSVAGHGYIVDARPGVAAYSVGTGGSSNVTYGLVFGVSGTSSGTLTTQTGVTTPINIVDLLNGTATGTLNGQDVTLVRGFLGIRPAANKATLADILRDTTTGQVLKSLVVSGGNQVQMTVTNGPLGFAFAGDTRVVTTALTSVAGGAGTNGVATGSGSFGIWTICADLTVTGPSFNLTLVSPSTFPGAGLAPIATILWDGTAFQQESIRYVIAPKLGSLDLSLSTVVLQPTNATLNATNLPTPNLNTYYPFPGTAPVTRYFSQAFRGVIHYTFTYTQPATAIVCYVGLLLGVNGAAASPAASQVVCGSVPVNGTMSFAGMLVFDGASQLGAGYYSFQPYVNASSNTTNIATITSLAMHGMFWAL